MLSTLVLATTLVVLAATLIRAGAQPDMHHARRQAYAGSSLVLLLLSLSLGAEILPNFGVAPTFGWAPLREVLRLAAAVLCVSATMGVSVLARHYDELQSMQQEAQAAENQSRTTDEISLRQQLEVANRGWVEATHRLTAAALASRRLASSLEDETQEVLQHRTDSGKQPYDSDRVRSLASLELPEVPEHRTINGWFRTLSLAEDVLAWVYDSRGQVIRAAGGGCERWFGVKATDTIGTYIFDWAEPHHLESFRSLQQDPTQKITLIQDLAHYPNAGHWLVSYQAVLTDGVFDGVLVVSVRLPGGHPGVLRDVSPLQSPDLG